MSRCNLHGRADWTENSNDHEDTRIISRDMKTFGKQSRDLGPIFMLVAVAQLTLKIDPLFFFLLDTSRHFVNDTGQQQILITEGILRPQMNI